MAVAGGYLRFNPHNNMKLGAILTGTTMAWYVMPGWEVNYLWGNSGGAEMNPIALGDRFNEYIITGMTPQEVIKFLDGKRDQVVKIADSTAGIVQNMGAWQHAYADDVEVRCERLQFTHLSATFAEVAQPPTAYLRQGLFDMGGCLTSLAGIKLFSEARECELVYHAIGSAIGMKRTEKLFENAGSRGNTFMLILRLGGHTHTWGGLPFADVPLLNGKTSFGMIADKLRGSKVHWYTPGTGFTMKKGVFHSLERKQGYVGKAARALGAFI